MKLHTVITYTVTELKERFPDAFERAHAKFIRDMAGETPWMEETCDSLKACIKAAGLKLRDWNLGAYNRNNFVKVDFSSDEVADLSGKRAFAWLENNLFASLRVSWTGKERAKLRKYGKEYYAGKIKPCPLTGMCFDEDYLDSLRDDVKHGCTLKEAFQNLADVCARLLEAECEATQKEDYFIGRAEANDMQFTEEGEEF